ncbi:hypothetical protein BCV69DRAFT_279145 [Microstroma glucosiphilum]|uniref:Uncharacterized protein n=1 Tax=Pseudomicrostroma glucosiphilum TaxID=1684307 RepID=A0A316TZV3_9BASI|nr:hypothetical protein BCV69DRAFT_279145 [Pseudomicrostroma glucosiphilum]PWN18158.1 hypothetical protein BCV69DRAFT_279145 [Pseudomicrostroma glucosiphilum]
MTSTAEVPLPAEAAMGPDNHGTATPLRLPVELLEVIIPLACGVSPSATPHHVDAKAAARIARVSKQLYRYALPLLYTCVTLAKPSQVLLFARTIVKKPKLAKMTKTVWIGPNTDTLLSPFWWPLNTERTAMRSSLTDPDKLPKGVASGKWWPVPALRESGDNGSAERSAEAAVARLIKAVWRKMGATMTKPNRCNRCSSYGRHRSCYYEEEEWRLKAFEVQRLLDQYLQEWRQRQNAALWSNEESVEDPAVPKAAGEEDWPDPKTWFSGVAWDDIIFGRGPSDLFDHPRLYNRSGVGKFSEGAKEYKFAFSKEGWKRYIDVAEYYTLDSIDNLRSQTTPTGLLEITIFEVLEAAKIILIKLPQLSALALTGYVRAVLSGSLPAGPQGTLKLLSLGPLAQPPRRPLAEHQQPLQSVEVMHVQNDCLSSREIELLDTLLPKLKKIRWNFWAPPDCTTEAEPLERPECAPLIRRPGSNDPSEFLQMQGIMLTSTLITLLYETIVVWAFNLVQKQWNEEVEKMLRNDTQLFPGLVFPDNDTSGR